MTWEKAAKEINEKRDFADQMGGKEAVELQYKKGRLPVRAVSYTHLRAHET